MRAQPRYPDFLCIGAQKAGTSWLYHNLRHHPEIWLPPLKELHYFDTKWPSDTSRSSQWNKLWSQYARHLLNRAKNPRLALDSTNRWLIRYLFQPRNDHWYGSLFPSDPNLVVGEITPKYAILDKDVVAHIASLMPRAKIIYLLRNPIERSWSAAAMHLENRCATHIDRASDDEIRQALNWIQPISRADYLKHIDLWSLHFGRENLFIGFFDELAEDPAALLRRVFDFLSVESSVDHVPACVREAINAQSYEMVPERHLRYLAEFHLEQIRSIHDGLANENTKRWLDLAIRSVSPECLSPNDLKGDPAVAGASRT